MLIFSFTNGATQCIMTNVVLLRLANNYYTVSCYWQLRDQRVATCYLRARYPILDVTAPTTLRENNEMQKFGVKFRTHNPFFLFYYLFNSVIFEHSDLLIGIKASSLW